MNPQGGGMRRSMRSFMKDDSVTEAKIAKGTYKRILKFAVPYQKKLFYFFLLVVIDAAIGAVNPLIFREIINEGILAKHAAIVIHFALIVAGLAIIDALTSLAQRYFSSQIGEGLIFDMRTKIFAHIQQMPIAFFTRTQTGSLVSRLDNDIQGAQQAFTSILSTVIGNIVSVVLVLIAMFFLSWQLTLVSLIMLPLFVLPARWFGRKLQKITRESYELNAQMNITMIERFNVAGAILTKLFGNLGNEKKSFSEKAGRVRDIGISQAMYGRIFSLSLMLTASLATALIYGWGGILAVQGALNVGTVIALTAYLNRLYGPLTALSNINVDIMTALVSFERVFEVLDLKPMIQEKKDAKNLERGKMGIAFQHVDFSYPTATEVSLASLEAVAVLDQTKAQEVLFDINFVTKPGSLTALVGPSGAGKSTITQLVARLYDVKSGAVLINDTDVRDLTLSSLHACIGMVTQEAHMFHDTIRANLLYAKSDATDQELLNALQSAQILPMIQSLPKGLDTLVGDRGYRLSGGEKQRIAIARLLLKAPDIIILDEATAHLDSESEVAVQKAFQVALKGRTSLVIAHRLSTIRNADQILVVDKGRIVERGKHEILLKQNGLYAELYNTQFAQTK